MAPKNFASQSSQAQHPNHERSSTELNFQLRGKALALEASVDPIIRAECCDASPELLKIAKAIGVKSGRECSVCKKFELLVLDFAFGEGFRSNGTCLQAETDIPAGMLCKKDVILRQVEVCRNCKWNYIIKKIVHY